ncbi:hypothetical protein AGMMS50276_29440 [Synergistales bacterium]|nr:hypothetical protein AGMMS50276_29440 [Synergistales bacterium]
MWLACYTQEEIAAAEKLPRVTVTDKIKGFVDLGQVAQSDKNSSDADASGHSENKKLSKAAKAAADYITDFEPLIYNIWRLLILFWRVIKFTY